MLRQRILGCLFQHMSTVHVARVLYTRRMKYIHFLSFALVPLFVLFTTPSAEAVSIEVQRESRYETYGEMTIITPRNSTIEVGSPIFTEGDLLPGLYNVILDPPAGTSTTIEVTINGELTDTIDGARFSFTAEQDDVVHISVLHTFTRTGLVTIHSDPDGIEFTLLGPDGLEWEGVTPMDYEDVPVGQYSVTYHAPDGCSQPKTQSDRFEKGGRINFLVRFDCDAADRMRQEEHDARNTTDFSVTVDGKQIFFTDVDGAAWYAPYVSKVIDAGVLAGYNDENGNSTNRFGPGDSVNLAQLSKVAHRVAGISLANIRNQVQNKRAVGTWFETYFASAEAKLWIPYVNITADPNRLVTRAEVVSTILQALEREVVWPTGTYFKDVKPQTPYSFAIERAAIDGLIDTSVDTFRPNEPINRAELSKLLTTAIELYVLTEQN